MNNSIIQSIRNGKHEEAFRYLYKGPLRKVRNYILNNSGSLADADDVFQDAVMVLFHYVKTGKYKEEYNVEGFLYRVAKNSWITTVRKRNKIVKSEMKGFDVSEDDNYLNTIISEEKLTTFHRLFNQLEENCKKILSLVVFDKKSMKEIAEILGFKDDKVAKNQHYRCKKYFQKIIYNNQEALNILRD